MVKIFVQIMRKNCFMMHHLLLFICIKQVFSLYLILKICLDQEVALIKTDHHLNIFNYNQNKLIGQVSTYWVFKFLFLSKISKAKAWSNKERLLLHYDHELHLVLEAIKFCKRNYSLAICGVGLLANNHLNSWNSTAHIYFPF